MVTANTLAYNEPEPLDNGQGILELLESEARGERFSTEYCACGNESEGLDGLCVHRREAMREDELVTQNWSR